MSKFDSIRFYRDEEVSKVLQGIANHPMVKSLIEYTFPGYSEEQIQEHERQLYAENKRLTKVHNN